ncbi:hypothetical protein RB614_20190 [Phytohabitans sp. ZYX-F-186]|uniref:Lipoprotein n=1 Tax=Phytohabitans maris TaxID=3071409 RepID=A0ABU0ZIG1_9ACTN|nr:hypothetical protein [Phytohabitans sp. ZYX-F-186]MDQ7906839.1 hypothetical protein [Phytohabitans sp. ZYX-F-186]
MRVRIHLALAAAALAFLSACGGETDAGGVATVGGSAAASPSASADTADQGRKFAQCMRDNGLPDFPDPGPNGQPMGGGDFDRKKLTSDAGVKALQACRDLAPNGGERADLDPAQQEQLRQWAECMRANGIEMPDPNPNTGGFLGLDGGELPFDPDDPKFQAAMEACQDKFTFRGQGGDQ